MVFKINLSKKERHLSAMRKEFYFRFLRCLSIILVSASLLFILTYTFTYIYPFIIALLIAFLLHPIVTWMEKYWKLNRAVATLIMMLCFFSFFIALFFLIIKQLLKESTILMDKLPKQFGDLKIFFSNIGQTYLIPFYEKLEKALPIIPSLDEWKFNQSILFLIDEIKASSTFFLKNIVLTTSNVLSSLTYIGTIFIFILLAVFMITKDLEQLKVYWRKLVPIKMIKKLNKIGIHLKISVFGFMKAQIIITLISSTIVMIGLMIYQVENVLLITLTVLFVDFIPYAGVGAVFLPWITYNFFSGDYLLTIKLATLYVVIIIIRQLIEPRILASSVGIHPLIALMILFIGIQSLGIIGIFLTPIVLISISAIYHAGIIHFIWNYIKHG